MDNAFIIVLVAGIFCGLASLVLGGFYLFSPDYREQIKRDWNRN